MYNDVQTFLGLIQYLAHYMPDVSTYTTPLAGCVRNNHPFKWTPLLDKCLQSIKALACKVPILRPVDPKNPDPIWVIMDGSKSGIMLGPVPRVRFPSFGFGTRSVIHSFLSLPSLPIYIPHHPRVPSSHTFSISPDVASLRSCYLIVPLRDSDSSYHI
jgi:hypothetical protein